MSIHLSALPDCSWPHWTEKWVLGSNSPVKNSLILSSGCLYFFSSLPPEQEPPPFVQLSDFLAFCVIWVSRLCFKDLYEVALTLWAFCKAWSQASISEGSFPLWTSY
jgi:hypothetical protein